MGSCSFLWLTWGPVGDVLSTMTSLALHASMALKHVHPAPQKEYTVAPISLYVLDYSNSIREEEKTTEICDVGDLGLRERGSGPTVFFLG